MIKKKCYFFIHISFLYYLSSRKKVEEEKPSPIISPQARTGSTSTDVTYASQYVKSYDINLKNCIYEITIFFFLKIIIG